MREPAGGVVGELRSLARTEMILQPQERLWRTAQGCRSYPGNRNEDRGPTATRLRLPFFPQPSAGGRNRDAVDSFFKPVSPT